MDNVLPPFQGEKLVFFAILAVARMAIWMTRKGFYDDAKFSHRDLVLYFRHQLKVKIRSNRKRLDRITFDKRCISEFFLPFPSYTFIVNKITHSICGFK